MICKIEGEEFQIEKIRSTLNPNRGKYRTGYYLKNERAGTLIVEQSIKKVEDVLKKVSKTNKIYSTNQFEDVISKKQHLTKI